MGRDNLLPLMWAKTNYPGPGEPLEYLKLTDHALDSVHAAEVLWDSRPVAVRHRLADLMHLSVDEVRRVLVFLAGAHDVGKCSRAFSVKNSELWAPIEAALEGSSPTDDLDQPHAFHSALALVRWFRSRPDLDIPPSLQFDLAAVPGGHHGVYQRKTDLSFPLELVGEAEGEDPWFAAQSALLDLIAERTGAISALNALKVPFLGNIVVSLLTGLVIQADWTASNSFYYPLGPVSGEGRPAREHRAASLTNRQAAPRFTDPSLAMTADHFISSRFARSRSFSANPYQRQAWDIACGLSDPAGLLLVEAPTGQGKTELALTYAEVLAARFGYEGLAFLLPTTATADGVLGRIRGWLERALPRDQVASMGLAHGRAELNEFFTELPSRPHAPIDDLDAPSERVYADASCARRKLRLNSHVVVGTIDQLLFAGLDSKHVSIRHEGLAGKVVIIDEVHATTPYMRVFLSAALRWLSALRVPVVVMTATLPPAAREDIVSAYREPLGWRERDRLQQRGNPLASSAAGTDVFSDDYPRLCYISPEDPTQDLAIPVPLDQTPTELTVSVIEDSDAELAARLDEGTRDGGCVAVICNTIRRAQELYREVSKRVGGGVVLLHSQFTAADRASRERALLRQLGPADSPEVTRPHRLIVIGTSVLEQSLDIDVDLLVTDLAPMDLLIQRCGRLHRHPGRVRPRGLDSPRVLIRGVSFLAGSPVLDQAVASIHPKSILYETLAAITHVGSPQQGTLRLPHEASHLVRQVYLERPAKERGWNLDLDSLRDEEGREVNARCAIARSACLRSPAYAEFEGALPGVGSREDLMRRNNWTEPEAFDAARVRDAEDSFEVILVRDDDGAVSAASPNSPLNDVRLTDLAVLTAMQAQEFLMQRIRLPRRLITAGTYSAEAREARTLAVLDELEAQKVDLFQQHRLLAGELVLRLDSDLKTKLGGKTLEYSSEFGLMLHNCSGGSDG
ncbi:CRISPR-associated helicase Cas3' [Kocuria koreensis]|uniref:CRISPR-associated helicase Cas3 n=1 Tax=Rothia koreensis TaxID=592378 RepID=A0A7K1LI55_9MICC|nr:CRISPR-associated helicase Cas3' [Rothia koreensis]MUN54865.1 CRISPR-associated helicase Cas3' [Rothia koreensis]